MKRRLDYDTWSLMKKRTNNVICVEGGYYFMLHFKYIRPYELATNFLCNNLSRMQSRAYFCASCFACEGRPPFSLFNVNFGSLEFVMAGVQSLSALEYMLLCPIRLYLFLVMKIKPTGKFSVIFFYHFLYMVNFLYIYSLYIYIFTGKFYCTF